MRIEEALWQVRTIQQQVARTERYCCYRWATVAASGLLAFGAAALQSDGMAEPAARSGQFLLWWIGVAAASVTLIGAEMWRRWRNSDSDFARRQTTLAVGQFAPSVVAAALVTAAIQSSCPEHAPLYPAIWSVAFSLGIFASHRQLPAGGIGLAAYYLLAGLVCIRWGQGDQALRPWTMVITFGVGQLLTAAVLLRQREDADGCS